MINNALPPDVQNIIDGGSNAVNTNNRASELDPVQAAEQVMQGALPIAGAIAGQALIPIPGVGGMLGKQIGGAAQGLLGG